MGAGVAAGGVAKRRMRISKIGSRIMYQAGGASPAVRPTSTQSDAEAMLHPLESQGSGAFSLPPRSDLQLDILRAAEYGEHRALFNGPTKKRLEDYLSPRHRKTCGSGVEMELSMLMSSTHLQL